MTTYYARLKGTAFCNPSRVEVGSDNTNVTGWPVTQPFIYCVAIGRDTRDPPAETFKLQWRLSGGSFADLGATGAMKYTTSTVLSNGTALTSGNAKVAVSSMTWQNGEEVEDGISGSIDLGSDCYTEIQYGVDPAGASAGSTYNFQVVSSVNGILTAETGSMLNVSVVAGTYEVSATFSSTTVTESRTVAIQEATPRNISGAYDSVSTDSTYVVVELSEPLVEDANIDVYDSISVDEYSDVAVSGPSIDTYSDVDVSEYLEALINLSLDIYSDVNVSEESYASVSDLSVEVSSNINVTEYIEELVSDLNLVTYDDIEVSEYTEGLVGELNVSVYDDATIIEYSNAALSGGTEVIIEDIEIFFPLAVSVFDLSQLTEEVVFEALLADVLINVSDIISVSEYTVGEESDLNASVFEGCIVEEFCLTEVSVLLVNAYDSVAVSEWLGSNVGDLSVTAYSTTSCYDTAVVEVSDLILIAYESISVTEYFIVFPEVQGTVSGTDEVQVADVPTLAVSDPQVSVSDLIVVSEQAQAAFSHMLAVLDSVVVAEQITAAVSDLQLVAFDSISIVEYVSYLSDYAISIYDSASVLDLGIVQVGIVIAVYDSVSATSDTGTYITTEINVEDSVVVAENVSGGSSDLDVSVSDAVRVIDIPEVYWIIASGVLVLDIDIIVPICDVEVMVPDVSIKEFAPSCDVELKSASINIYAMLPTIDLEMQT